MSNFHVVCNICGHTRVASTKNIVYTRCDSCQTGRYGLEDEVTTTPAAELPDSGAKRTFPSGAWRDNADGKGRYDLLPPAGIFAVAKRFEDGAKKYGDNNWQKGSGMPMEVFYDSAMRHLFKAMAGQTDEDHLAAAAWNILCAIETRDVLSKKLQKIDTSNLPVDFIKTS